MTTFYCVPERLIMRAARCRYCPADHKWDIYSGDQEGIRTCAAHKPDAERDCNAHFHKTCVVRLRDARAPLAEFFAALAVSETFSVRRSNGALDPGWRIPIDSFPERFVVKICNTDWGVPVVRGDGMDEINKKVRLTDFLKPEVRIPGITADLIGRTLAILDAGIYKADAEAQDAIGVMAPTGPDHNGIRLMQGPAGELIRAFIPPS